MKNWVRTAMVALFQQAQRIPFWKGLLLALLGTLVSAGLTALCIIAIFQSARKPLDWTFLAIVTGGITLLALALALALAIGTAHWIDPRRGRRSSVRKEDEP